MFLLSEIRQFLADLGAAVEGRRLLIAFSGGPDSTALLWGLRQVELEFGLDLRALHIDHQLDGDSPRRAERARIICSDLGVRSTLLRCPVDQRSSCGENRESAARRLRYHLLENQRRDLDAAFVVTAHHADDQIETVLMRILQGTGIEGLAAIRPRHQNVLRPLLRLGRTAILEAVAIAGLEPVEDPTNLNLHNLRNRVRHLLVPHLRDLDSDLEGHLLQLASSAHRNRERIERLLRQALDVRRTSAGGSMNQQALQNLPWALWSYALSMLHREASIAYPASAAARRELKIQLHSAARVGVDCGAGWRWESQGDRLTLARPSPKVPGFAYTVVAPGECEIPELALRFRIRRGAVDAWMFRPSSRRAGLDLPIGPGDQVIVRSRRDGDRVRPFGCSYTRRLKDVLIDRRVPRQERGRLPLLEVDSRLAWIPGVTVDDAFRVETGGRAWIAELESI